MNEYMLFIFYQIDDFKMHRLFEGSFNSPQLI